MVKSDLSVATRDYVEVNEAMSGELSEKMGKHPIHYVQFVLTCPIYVEFDGDLCLGGAAFELSPPWLHPSLRYLHDGIQEGGVFIWRAYCDSEAILQPIGAELSDKDAARGKSVNHVLRVFGAVHLAEDVVAL